VVVVRKQTVSSPVFERHVIKNSTNNHTQHTDDNYKLTSI